MRNRFLAACVVILWCDLICPSASFLVCIGGVFVYCLLYSSFLSDFLYRSICRFIAAILPIYKSGRDLTTWFVSGVLSNERSHCLTVTPRGTLSRSLLTNERLFVTRLYYSTYVFIHVFFTLARLRSAILNIGFDEICTPISKLSFVAISNSKILKPKESTFSMVPRRFLSISSSYHPPITI